MVKIQVEICQCDFCSVKELVLPECILCKKNMCEKHRLDVGVKVLLLRSSNEREYYKYSRTEYICPECANDKPNLLRKSAIVLTNEADRIENEPPPEPTEI